MNNNGEKVLLWGSIVSLLFGLIYVGIAWGETQEKLKQLKVEVTQTQSSASAVHAIATQVAVIEERSQAQAGQLEKMYQEQRLSNDTMDRIVILLQRLER